MSHFIVGRIKTNSSVAGSLLAKHLPDLGKVAGLTVNVLSDDKTLLQWEVLNAAYLGNDGPGVIFFEIVGTSGTADELISPYLLVHEWSNAVIDVSKAISNFTCELLTQHHAHEVSIVFSEGLDTSYEVLSASAQVIAESLIKKFNEAGEVPSLAIVMMH